MTSPGSNNSTLCVSIPPEVEPYTNDIRRFIDAMVYKLRVHHKKGRWEELSIQRVLELMTGEEAELRQAVDGGNTVDVLLEAADVANYAMIAASIAVERGN